MEEIRSVANEIVLDGNVPLSLSRLWDYQRNFYKKQSINAWANKVPFYITSNPYIANSYAHIIIRFIQDCIKINSIETQVPLYIVELGAGSGTFSFYVLKRLFELKRSLAVDINLVYIMTDLVQENIDFWMSHESFQPYVAARELDFACFDAEHSTDIFLLKSNITLGSHDADAGSNPFIFISNYCFDSLRHDVFRVVDNKLFEGLCTSSTEADNINGDGVIQLDKVKTSFNFKEIQLPYYQNELLNQILLHYKTTANHQYISFPVGPLMCISNLLAIANNRMLLISSDKGFSKHLEINQKHEPDIVFHDNCFSLCVNFDAINHYFKQIGGDSFNQFTEQSLTTCAFTSGFKFAEMPETLLALETFLNSFGHSTINNLFLNAHIPANLNTIESILPFLGAIGWDTAAFNSCRDAILNQLRKGFARISDIEDLKEKMPLIEANFYKLPTAADTFFDIGIFFQETKHYDRALYYYQKSIDSFGEKDITLYNMGLCYYFLEQPQEAIIKFSEALKCNPQYILARGWISQIESEKEALVKVG